MVEYQELYYFKYYVFKNKKIQIKCKIYCAIKTTANKGYDKGLYLTENS